MAAPGRLPAIYFGCSPYVSEGASGGERGGEGKGTTYESQSGARDGSDAPPEGHDAIDLISCCVEGFVDRGGV